MIEFTSGIILLILFSKLIINRVSKKLKNTDDKTEERKQLRRMLELNHKINH